MSQPGGERPLAVRKVGTVAVALARRVGDADRAAAHLRALPYHRFVAVDRALTGLAARLAAERRLHGRDAVYVALAQQQRMCLITWDQQQRERASRSGEILTPVEAVDVLA